MATPVTNTADTPPTSGGVCASQINTLPANALIGEDGQPRFGHFDSPVTDLMLSQFDYRTVMDKPASQLARYFHFKQFQFVSLSHADWQIGIAIADIRYVANGFCYLNDPVLGILKSVLTVLLVLRAFPDRIGAPLETPAKGPAAAQASQMPHHAAKSPK